jgi:lipopolysaccharide transport system ATP-binding protein
MDLDFAMKPIIKVENLSKRYNLGGSQKAPSTLIESISNTVRAPWQLLKRNFGNDDNSFWALKDVNFEINPGEVVGIIGRNGAGKSTLLKILSRITKPTTGKIELYGRIESLLEVGTGFHPELTGRENIFLNGAILGMKHSEIAKKFDEIVAFAEIEKFLDTAVKHYSSGMYVRLAFAVAAHLEPEILIIDEVLAVGDAEFQKKCLGKMNEVSKNGRTVIFVSHQMGSIAQLCQKAILLEKGFLKMQDQTNRVIEHYVNQGKSQLTSYTANISVKEREMYVQSAIVLNDGGIEQLSFRHDESIHINVKCVIKKWLRGVELRLAIKDRKNTLIFVADAEINSISRDAKAFAVDFTIPPATLRSNNYSLSFALIIPHQLVIESSEDDVLFFSVYDAGTKYAQSEGMDYGLIFSPCKISIKQTTDI